MTMNRRAFLRTGALSALAAGVVLSSPDLAAARDPRAVPQGADSEKNFYATRDSYVAHVGSTFRGRGVGGGAVNLVLVAVHDRTPKPEDNELTQEAHVTDSFTLVFRADGELTDLTTIHRLEHAALGSVSLFLTHSADDKGRHFYEAAFNHTR